jgi:arabinogalactan oligomer/maltooligosaccharide transport system substrate-binding protein
MTRQRCLLALAVVTSAIVAAALPSAAASRPVVAKKGVNITIWDYFVNSPKERAALMKVANQWAKATGNTVTNPGDVTDSLNKYPLAAKSGRGPDVVQFPHDRLGSFAAPGLLAPQPAGLTIDKSLYAPVGIQAVTYKGKMWGLPIALETTFLFYNKALVPTPPKTWPQLIATATKLTSGDKYGFLWNPTDLYYDYAFIGGFGGFGFQPTKNGFNPRRLGLATAGAISGLQFIQDLVMKYKLVPPTTNYDIMDGKFANGQAAMVINGPWAVQNYQAKGINFGVEPIPNLPNGKPATPFVGVQMLAVNSKSKHVKEAWDLVNYLSTHLPLPLYRASGRVPATIAAAKNKAVLANPVTQTVLAAAAKGQPMPNIPEMSVVWTPVGNALQLLVKGELSAHDAAIQMTNQVAKAISQQQSP